MIEFENNGKVVTVEFDEEQQCHIIKLAKKYTFKPNERFEIKTKLTVHCTHQLDECVVQDYLRDDVPAYILSDKYSNNNPEKEIEIVGFYVGDNPMTLEKGDTLACAACYHKCTEESEHYLPLDEQDKPIVYMDETIKVQSMTGEPVHIETVIEPDGTRYVKIPLERVEDVEA